MVRPCPGSPKRKFLPQALGEILTSNPKRDRCGGIQAFLALARADILTALATWALVATPETALASPPSALPTPPAERSDEKTPKPNVAATEINDSSPKPPVSETVIPPRLLVPLTPSYPKTAQGRGRVVLAITVAKDGSVRDAQALDGDGDPFRQAALDCVQNARFEPAQRGTETVAAKIRLEVVFVPPEANGDDEGTVPEEPASDADSQKGTATEPPRERIETVTVHGELPEPNVGTQRLGKAEVRLLPGAFGDPFRAIEIMPGVTPIVSGLPFYYIRGSPPGNVGYFLDGVRVPYLFHFAVGPGVIHPGLLEAVDLETSYPAFFGRFAGAIVSGQTSAPKGVLRAEANLRLVDAGGLVEVPFAEGKGSVLLGGRFSYTAALLSLAVPESSVSYQDYQSRVSYALSANDRLTLLAFGAVDLVGEKRPDGTKRTFFASEFHRVDARYDRTWDNGATARVAVTFGVDRSRLPIGDQSRFASDIVTGLRAHGSFPVHRTLTLRAGFDATLDHFDADLPKPFSGPEDLLERERRFFQPRLDYALGPFVDGVWSPHERLEIVPGARADLFASSNQRALAFDPRLALRLRILDTVSLVGTAGMAHQPPAFPMPIPGLGIPRLQGGLQETIFKTVGVEAELPLATRSSVVVFHNAFTNLVDPFQSLGNSEGFELFNEVRTLRGDAYGVELSLRRKWTQRVGWYASYTLSRANRRTATEETASNFDRTHVLNLALSADLGRHWRLGSRLLTYSGRSTKGLLVEVTPEGRDAGPARPPSLTPAYYRLDVRLEKRWLWGSSRFLALVLEGLNVTLNREVVGYECGESACKPVQLPLAFPMLSLEGGL